MQAHKLSSYNTELSNSKDDNRANGFAKHKVELVKGKPMLTSVMNEPEQKEAVSGVSTSSNDTEGQFDFAGLAG